MKQIFLLFVVFVFGLLLQDQQQAAAWVIIGPALTTFTSSPSSYIRAPGWGGTAKMSKLIHRLHRRCFLPQASSEGGEGGTGKGSSPTQRKTKNRGRRPAASSSNDAIGFAEIVTKSNQGTIYKVDDKLERALGKWLD